jgi:tight adherence protein C
MALVLGVLLVAVALVLLSMALSDEPDRRGVARSLALVEAGSATPQQLVAEAAPPFGTRVLGPLRERARNLGRRLAGSDAPERIRRRLDLAGNPAGWNVDRVLTLTVLGAVGGLVVGALVGLRLGTSVPALLVLLAACALVGFHAPGIYLHLRAEDRAEQVRRALPDAIDMLTISVEAGLGFDAAVQQVAHRTEGPLADELSRMLREMQLGRSRADALRGLAERSKVAELRGFVGAMVQADGLGIPVAQVLRVQSAEIRVKRRQRAEEQAQQVPVKMTIPLIFCIMPCLMIVVMGPAALQMMDTF